jgi:hypothetical protein
MKNLKELQAILTSVYCINYASEHRDPDIRRIVDYAFRRLFGANTNLLTLCCVGRSKEDIIPELMQVLESETQFKQYLEEKENHKTMLNLKTVGRINSLNGKEDEITVLEKVQDKDNDYIVEYKGVRCHALFNWFVNRYYVDDVYGRVGQ